MKKKEKERKELMYVLEQFVEKTGESAAADSKKKPLGIVWNFVSFFI
jgi:hypothetical protein